MQGQTFMTMKFGLKDTEALQVTMKENSTPKHLAKTELQCLWGNKQTYCFVTLMSCTYAAENPMCMDGSAKQKNNSFHFFVACRLDIIFLSR